MSTITNQQAVRTASSILSSGGATFNEKGLLSYLKGYQVGAVEGAEIHEMPTGYDRMQKLAELVQDYSAKHWGNWVYMGLDLGAWVNGGLLHLDRSMHFDSLEEAMDVARANRQLSIYDWETGKDIDVLSWTQVSA